MKSLNTFILVDKPPTWTSFDVCAKLRKILNIKRIGHTGTLDPFATGLLIVAVGKCTKLIPLLEKDKKTYRTKILLGKTSETLDPESEVIDTPSKLPLRGGELIVPNLEAVKPLLQEKFTGKIEQIPPQYSALKVDGKRAYDLARKGEKVELKPRATEVFSLKVLDYQYPELELELTAAAGFYVRSLARDVGEALAGGGLCAKLRRIGVGEITMCNEECVINNYSDRIPLEQGEWPKAREDALGHKGGDFVCKMLTEAELKTGDFLLEDYAIDPQLLIKNIVHLNLPPERLPDLQAGRVVMLPNLPSNGEKVLFLCEDQTVGLGEIKDGNVQPRVVF